MKNKERLNLIKAAVVASTIMLITVGYTYHNVFHASMPSDEMHRNVSSNYECLGCHNRARAGGDSFAYHFKKYSCRRCHLQ